MKNLVLTINFGKVPPWAINAKNKQLADWVAANKENLPFENIVVIPSTTETGLYWLEGDLNSPTDKVKLEEVKDRLKPILCAIINMDYKKDDPEYKKAIEELNELRALQAAKEKAKVKGQPQPLQPLRRGFRIGNN